MNIPARKTAAYARRTLHREIGEIGGLLRLTARPPGGHLGAVYRNAEENGTMILNVTIDEWRDGGEIPGEFAFCVPAEEGHVATAPNRNPTIRWSGAPAGTRSFAIICHDLDAPSAPDNVNKEGLAVPADLPRVDFYHWVLVDIPADTTMIAAGADSDGVTVGGKPPGATDHGLRGVNDYTAWFAGDEQMAGTYGGYDGPCPPWNDERPHHYVFTVHALDAPSLGLSGEFGGGDALAAMEGHVLAKGSWTGTYTLNPALRGG